MVQTVELNTDSLFLKLSNEDKREVLRKALSEVRMTTSELDYKGGYTEQLHRNTRRHEMEAINKFTLALQCLLFFFIGAPLGAIIRKGGLGLPIVISVIFFVIYYIITITSQRIAIAGDIPVFLGVWLSSLIILPLGIFLTVKATTDSSLLDGESWKKTFNKIFRKS